MRDTYLIWDGRHDWKPVSDIPTGELQEWLIDLANGNIENDPASPNGGQTDEQCRDRILIELRARELGLV